MICADPAARPVTRREREEWRLFVGAAVTATTLFPSPNFTAHESLQAQWPRTDPDGEYGEVGQPEMQLLGDWHDHSRARE